jgi:hypothetical protein
MALQHMTVKLVPQTSSVIPPGKFIYTDETFLIQPPKYIQGEAFPQQGKPLVPAHFSYGHHNPDFTPIYTPATQLAMNFNTYIYNSVTGYT